MSTRNPDLPDEFFDQYPTPAGAGDMDGSRFGAQGGDPPDSVQSIDEAWELMVAEYARRGVPMPGSDDHKRNVA